ncbi:S-layer homology domain-containing protein [Evtepia sp.]|uniref:S-layer homology domain-containing protein n=1 Tax=Evtepia sp. TaxID=2773933 RepID=UPI002A763635|nr:S-layer homology domain-containing protein [Evtepia sp.]
MKQKRLFSCLLALLMLLTVTPAPVALAAGTAYYNGKPYSTDYTTWRQGDSAWGDTPLGDLHTMAGSGCLVTSIAILMCHSKAYDPADLNPGVYRDWLDSKGYISHSSDRSKDALLSFGLITKYSSPRFYFVNQTFFPVSTPLDNVVAQINDLLASGYYVIARVKNSGHFVPIAKTTDGDALLYDPGYASKKLLSEYNGTIGGLIYFKADLAGKDTILGQTGKPGTPVVSPIADTFGDHDPISVSWGKTNNTTHYNVYVDMKQANGTWKDNYRYYFYTNSPFTVDPLPPGQYRLKVQSTNANNNYAYSNSEYQYFTVKSGYLTITYDPAGGAVSPTSQFVKANSIYNLPTPTKSGAAFLGWYTKDGKMVNYETSAGSDGHTLTARWASSGVGFKKQNTYQNEYIDVPKTAWYYDNVVASYEYGLMNGMDGRKFAPQDQITSIQAITLAARMRKLYLTGNGSFPSSTPWYKAYTDYAISQGIISSVPSNPNLPLTRQEFANIIANALPADALPEINSVPYGSIPDVYRSDEAIHKLYRAGIFAGIDAAGTFRPNASITRAEVASVVVRMADPNLRERFSLS